MPNDEIETIKLMLKGYEASLPKLNILIFGPGESNRDEYANKCFRKRCEIKQFLKEKNHIAILPEEAFEEAKRQGKVYPNIIHFEKYLLEQCCDVAIFLYVPKCPGVDHELSTLATIPECTRKILLLHATDCEYDSTWSFNDRIDFIRGGNGRTETFCQEDVDRCHLRERIVRVVESMARFLSLHPYKKYEEVQ